MHTVSSWIEASLQAAVIALVRNGDLESASALARLLEEPDVRELPLYRSREAATLAEVIADCEDLEELHLLLGKVVEVFRVEHCTVHRIRERNVGDYGPKVLTTYPEEWIDEYIARRYFGIDPVVARALEGPGVFFWDAFVGGGPVVNDFQRAAIAYGIGPAGITLVGDNPAGDSFAVSLSSRRSPASFRDEFEPRLADFLKAAKLTIEVFSDLTCVYPESHANLTVEQIRLLRMLARGGSLADLHAMPASAGSAAMLERSILQALNASSLIQAVAIAAKHGLLETVQFFEDDLFRPQGRVDERALQYPLPALSRPAGVRFRE